MEGSTKPYAGSYVVSGRGVLFAALLVLMVALALWMVVVQGGGETVRSEPARSQIAFEEATGVRVVRVVLAAAGGLIDIHYQILDPDKALVVHDKGQPPTIIDDRGREFKFKFHEHGSGSVHLGRTYRLHLMNSGGALERGDAIALRIGGARLEPIIVQ